jgi:hypothetical protein
MTRLAFLSPHEADSPPVSPLAHLASTAYTDVSGLGKLEVHGGVPEGAVPIGIDRGLLVVEGDPRPERDRLTAEGYRVYDLTSALAGLEVEGERLMRRLTELDLDALPAVGSIARGTPAIIERIGPERFRLFVPQELAQYVAEVVDDQSAGLA